MTFLGVNATIWAAAAAFASFAAAFISAFMAYFLSRPRLMITVELAYYDPLIGALYRSGNLSIDSFKPPYSITEGIESITVRVENAGRTTATISLPHLKLLDRINSLEHWKKFLLNRQHYFTPHLLSIPDQIQVINQPIRIEPYAQVEFFLDPVCFLEDPSTRGARTTSWDYLRVAVKISGKRRPVIARHRFYYVPTCIPATIRIPSGQQQFSGAPLSLRQFLFRWFLRQSLLSSPNQIASFPDQETARMMAIKLAISKKKLSFEVIQDILKTFESVADVDLIAISVHSALYDAGFVVE